MSREINSINCSSLSPNGNLCIGGGNTLTLDCLSTLTCYTVRNCTKLYFSTMYCTSHFTALLYNAVYSSSVHLTTQYFAKLSGCVGPMGCVGDCGKEICHILLDCPTEPLKHFTHLQAWAFLDYNQLLTY